MPDDGERPVGCQPIAGYDPMQGADEAKAWYDPSIGQRAVDFFPACLKHIEGSTAGQPFVLEPWQANFVAMLFGWMIRDSMNRVVRRYREVFLMIPRKNGKALAVDTPIPTPDGWRSMGELVAGDTVFDELGQPTAVLAAHNVMHDHPCFRVGFSDGTSITADADHLWTVRDRYRVANGGWRTITTAEIAQTFTIGKRTGHRERRYSVPDIAPLHTALAELPVHPYILGAWLGDGDSDCARITMGDADAAETVAILTATGASMGARKGAQNKAGRYRVTGIQSELRALGVIRNKHIPAIYLRASITQRMELLRGLMDTDGCISTAGQCEFVSTSRALFDGVVELARSLGIKATTTEDRARVNGKDCGPRYRMQFFPDANANPFRLKRKAARVRARGATARSRSRQIVSVDAAPSVPVRCIRVDSPSSLYLAGPGMVATHNTPLAAGIGIYVFFCDREPGAQVFVAAADTEQAALLFRHAKGMVEFEPVLNKRADIFRGTGHRSMVLKHDPGSFFKVVSADANTKHGGNTHMAMIDELHAQKDRELVDVLETSMASATRAQPLMINITTADYERVSICNEKHDYARGVRDGTIRDHSFLPVVFEALPKDDWKDPKVWAKANPNLGVSVSLDYMQRKARKAESSPAYANTFKRLHLNIRTAQAAMLIDIEKWDQCHSDAPSDADLENAECYAGLDLSQTDDMTALALYFPAWKYIRLRLFLPGDEIEERERRTGIPYKAWADAGHIELTPGNVVDYAYVIAAVNQTKERYRGLQGVAYDPWNATQTALTLQDQYGVKMLGFRQGFMTMNEPVKEFLRLIKCGQLNHGGNPVLRWMALNASAKTDPSDNIKIDKKTSKGKVDGLVGSVMALGLHLTNQKESESEYNKPGAEILTLTDD